MAAGTQCTHWTFLTATIVFVEMVKRLAAVAPFDEESVEYWARVYTNTQTVASVFDFLPKISIFLEYLKKKQISETIFYTGDIDF